MPSRCEICCEILIAILLPPLGVCLRHGCCSVEFIICLLLTILGYVPGIIYALYAIVFINRDEFFDEYRRPLYGWYSVCALLSGLWLEKAIKWLVKPGIFIMICLGFLFLQYFRSISY